MMLVALQLYTFAYWKEVFMLVEQSKVLVILYGGIIYHSWRCLLAGIRAIFNCALEVVPGVLLIYGP